MVESQNPIDQQEPTRSSQIIIDQTTEKKTVTFDQPQTSQSKRTTSLNRNNSKQSNKQLERTNTTHANFYKIREKSTPAKSIPSKLTNQIPKPALYASPVKRVSIEDRNQAHLQKIKEKRFEENLLKELEHQRVIEAKQRLKNFIVHSDMQDTAEQSRLLKYFTSRYVSFMKLLTEYSRARKFNKAPKSSVTLEVPRHELKQAFILSNKEAYIHDTVAKEKASKEAKSEIKLVQKRLKVSHDTMVYKVCGTYHFLREYLNTRGMVEHDWIPKFEKEKFSLPGWNFLYTTKARDAFRMPHAEWQYVNHILGAKALCTKVGLTHMMKNLIWLHDRDINQTFPCSFDLTDLRSEETINFREDVKFNQVIAFLKLSGGLTKKQLEQQREQLIIAITILERRINVLSGTLFKQILNEIQFAQNELDSISDAMYDWFRGRASADFSRQAWYRPLMKQYTDITNHDLLAKVKQVCSDFAELIGKKQFDLNVGKNAWILKPGGKSRGRGIEIHTDLEDLLKSILVSSDTMWVAQKYIERPLIIIGKKFDIRVWVLVTSVEPLTIWMFMKPYLRFTSEDYDASQLHNKFSHLTNASINKNNKQASRVKTKGKYKIRDNMWEIENFQEYLTNEFGEESADPLTDLIFPQIKQGIIDSLLAVKEVLHHRDLSHELFGYDFMVDADLNVWLIEVNSSPSMEFSTPITEKLVKQMMPQVVKILLDHDHGSTAAVGEMIEEFELIYN